MLKRMFCIVIILFLVISALNISNQAINSLTMENRGPIFAVNLDEQDISIYLLGQNHLYSKDKLINTITLGSDYSHRIYDKVSSYLYKIWKISNVIFFDNYDLNSR